VPGLVRIVLTLGVFALTLAGALLALWLMGAVQG